eukprot:3565841-Amphidinium_carterae.1
MPTEDLEAWSPFVVLRRVQDSFFLSRLCAWKCCLPLSFAGDFPHHEGIPFMEGRMEPHCEFMLSPI